MATYRSIKYAFSGADITDIAFPPTVQSISPASLTEAQLPGTITVTGTNFAPGATGTFISDTGQSVSSPSIGYQSETSLTMGVPATITDAGEPWDVSIAGPISGSKTNLLSIDGNPTFTTGAGTLGTITNQELSTYTLSAATATDPEGVTVAHTITTGSVSPGLTFNSPAGTITGPASAVPSGSVTSTFTVRATAGSQTADREFTITVEAPAQEDIPATGAGSHTATFTGNMQLLLIGSGSAGTHQNEGGGGAGGLIFHPSYAVQQGVSYPYVVAAAAAAPANSPRSTDSTWGPGSGTDATFLTAMGGGIGASGDGGCGGGRSHSPGVGGLGIQTTDTGISADSRTYGFGNNGGASGTHAGPGHPSGGGGGTDAVGGNGSGSSTAGPGGAGKDYSGTVGTGVGASGLFGGGGGGGCHGGGSWGSGGAGGGGGRNQSGTANTGGGGGAGSPAGSSGMLILKY